jgi:hypothetical protein
VALPEASNTFSSALPVMVLLIAGALACALALAVAGRGALAAAVALSTVPSGGYLLARYISGLASGPVLTSAIERRVVYSATAVDLVTLLALYAAVIACAAYFRRRARSAARIGGDPTAVGG